MRRLLALAPVAVILLLVALFAGFSLHRQSTVVPTAMVGKPLPAVALAPLAGGEALPLRTLVKGPALVNFFASWCAPCAVEAPGLSALKAEGVRLVGVAYKDQAPAAMAFLDRFGDPYETVLADADGRAAIEFGVTGVPETYAVDAQGVIRAKSALPLTAADAERLLRAAGG